MPYPLSFIINIFLSELAAHHWLLFILSLLAFILLPWISKEYNRIVVLLIVWSINDALAIFTAIIFKNNSPVFHAYSLVSTALILVYYYPQLKNISKMRYVFWLGMGAYFVIWLVNMLYFQSLTLLPSNAIMFSSVLILFFVLSSYKYMLEHPIETSLFLQPRFWVNTGILIFYTSGFFYFFIHTYLQKLERYPKFLENALYYPNLIWVSCLMLGLLTDLKVFSIKKRTHEGNKL